MQIICIIASDNRIFTPSNTTKKNNKMKFKNNNSGAVYMTGREAVEALSLDGIITRPTSDKYNPSMILQRVIREGVISVITDTDTPTQATEPETDEAAQMIAQALRLIKPVQVQESITREQVMEMIREATPELKYKGLEITVNGRERVKIDGYIHPSFETLLTFTASKCNVWITGPAGSGKTSAVMQVAKAMELPFYSISVCTHSTKTDLFGYMGATGEYVPTDFYRAYSSGGIFLLDEADNGSPNIMNSMNQALSNGHCSFPCGMTEVHPDFYCLAAANTLGNGANIRYVGRQTQEKTLLDRFIFLHWPYDEAGEGALCGHDRIAKKVQELRHKAEKSGLNCVISPRASIAITKLMAMGVNEADATHAAIYAKLNDNDLNTLLR